MTHEHDNDMPDNNDMNDANNDDIRQQIAAWVAGELDSDQAAELERRITDDKDLAAEAVQLRQTADLLRNTLADETEPQLTDEQRQDLVAEFKQHRKKHGPPSRLHLWLLRTASAAAILLVGILIGTTIDDSSKHANTVVYTETRPYSADPIATTKPTTEQTKQQKITALKSRAERLQKERRYEESLQTMQQIAQLDPENTWVAENTQILRQYIMLQEEKRSSELGCHESFKSNVDWRWKSILGPGEHAIVNGIAGEVSSPSMTSPEIIANYQRALVGGSVKSPPEIPVLGNIPFLAISFRRHRETEALEGGDAVNGWNREAYEHVEDNPFLAVGENPLSTFSIDVDTASYTNVRRMLNGGQLPPAGAVRIEEMVNFFNYEYAPPAADAKHPFAVHVAAAQCPWRPEHRLVRVALKGKVIERDQRPPSNLVFLLDVSGSMKQPNKLPLVRRSMQMLVEQLGENDRVGIVVYAGAAGLVLDSTHCDRKEQILAAIEQLEAGGSTNGGQGIRLAYKLAEENFIKGGGVNRVILCTDGDFNVGTTSDSDLVELITEKAKSGVFLTVLGFGMGNLQDGKLEKLADKGNGTYGYIDSESEARRLFVEQLSGTLITIAKDVKIQVEFNPAEVAAYRLIGYENRMLAKEDFNDDTKDAGEIGSGHAVTALYEVVPAGQILPKQTAPADVDPLKYQRPAHLTDEATQSGEMLTVKLRYKQPDGEKSVLLQQTLAAAQAGKLAAADQDFRWAAAVASFGMQLRNSPYAGRYTLAAVEEVARAAIGDDPNGQRAEFIGLVRKAMELRKR